MMVGNTTVPAATMNKVHTVILEPGWIRDAVTVVWSEILSPFTMDMKLDGDRLAAALFHRPNGHPLHRSFYRLQGVTC